MDLDADERLRKVDLVVEIIRINTKKDKNIIKYSIFFSSVVFKLFLSECVS